MIRELPAVEIEGHAPTSVGNADHPMRHMTRRVAGLDASAPAWDADARHLVATNFDDLAADWHTRTSPSRTRIVEDVLERGVDAAAPRGVVVEVGSGIGTYSALLHDRFGGPVLAVELSMEMLRLSPVVPGHRLRADADDLPLGDGQAAAVVLINAFLFPAEVDRVLTRDGVVVWVNSSGEDTPIHLQPDEVAAVLPGEWDGVASRAGAGIWCVLHRRRKS